MTSGSSRPCTPSSERRTGPQRHWTRAAAEALFGGVVLLAFSGLSCSDDDDCHWHAACCGGITAIYHCHSNHHSHAHEGFQTSSQIRVLATDAPDESVRSLYVTITEITLESPEVHPQTVYRSDTGYRVDLLSLRGSEEARFYDLLTAPSLVPAATYDSIWISMKDPAIVFESGETATTAEIEFDGAIDVVFREPEPIGAEETTFVVLDFDVKRSLAAIKRSVPEPGEARYGEQRWRFRPLIFATVVEGEVSEALDTPTDLEGVVDELDHDARTFDLELPDGRGTLTAHAHRETVILGPELEPHRFADLRLGQTVRVRGYWRPDGALDVESVLNGHSFRIAGLVERVDDDGIVVSVATEERAPETLRVAAHRRTRLSFGRQEAAAMRDLEEGLRVTTIGFRSPDASRTAAIVDLEPGSTESRPLATVGSVALVEGRIAHIDRSTRTVTVRSGEGAGALDVEVEVPSGSQILFLERTDGVLWQTPVHFEQIRLGMTVSVERLPDAGTSPPLLVFELRP